MVFLFLGLRPFPPIPQTHPKSTTPPESNLKNRGSDLPFGTINGGTIQESLRFSPVNPLTNRGQNFFIFSQIIDKNY